MEILIIIGLLCYFWPVILGSLIILDAIIRSVYFWVVLGLIVLWCVVSYIQNNDNNKNGKDKK